jgi:hypothetical protein
MGKTMKVAMIVPITDDPTSFYRGVGPWTELQREVPELQLFYLQPPISWAQLKGKDYCLCNALPRQTILTGFAWQKIMAFPCG